MVTLNKYGNNATRQALELYGLSTDTKPVDECEGKPVENGSSFIETDTGKRFIFDYENKTWHEEQSNDLQKLVDVLSSGFIDKGEVDYYSSLPQNASVGDVYTVKYWGNNGEEHYGMMYAWGEREGREQWIPLGGDLENVKNTLEAEIKSVKEALEGKADASKVDQIFTEEDKAKLDSLTSPMVIKGTVTSRDVLDDIQAKPGWVFFVRPEGASKSEEYVFTEDGEWDPIGDNSIDLSDYVKKTDYATNSGNYGLVKVAGNEGIKISDSGNLAIRQASLTNIDQETNTTYPMTSNTIPRFMSNYGITKNTIQEIFDRLTALENPK